MKGIKHMPEKPSQVLINNKSVAEIKELSSEGFIWTKLNTGGLLTVQRKTGNSVIILK